MKLGFAVHAARILAKADADQPDRSGWIHKFGHQEHSGALTENAARVSSDPLNGWGCRPFLNRLEV